MRKVRLALLTLAVLLLLACAGAYAVLHASLPDLDGDRPGSGLRAGATIERDSLGVVTIRAQNRADLAWATGFAHAQDRFFQMDLARRMPAGELAQLFGTVALESDRRMRLHRFRATAAEVLRRTTHEERELLERYAAGVNAGLESLGTHPFEYWIIRGRPAPWRPEDCLLVVYAMYVDLTYEGFEEEAMRGAVRDTLPDALYRFIYSAGTEWDAPMVGPAFAVDPVPPPAIYDLRHTAGPQVARASALPGRTRLPRHVADELAPGSNNWAVAGAHTASGAGLVANDMHLGLDVPIVWYRARLQIVAEDGRTSRDLNGVTLPGVPSLVVGSNGSIAWGFTNSYGDWVDLVELEIDPASGERYATPDGYTAFEKITENIRVRGQPDELLEIRRTIWGPVFDTDVQGRARAAAWTAHDAAATNMSSLQLETARDVSSALDIAARGGIPPQNFVVADTAGNIGWTVMGRIPVRAGYDSRAPASWSRRGVGWQGWFDTSAYPRLVNPPQGRIWTANARVVEPPALDAIGDGGYALGVRAGQIRDSLRALENAREGDMLAIQLDVRTRLHERWRLRLLDRLNAAAVEGRPERAAARRLVEEWRGHAAADSPGYRLLRRWRDRVRDHVFAALTRAVSARRPDLQLRAPSQFEGPLWQLLRAEPAHLLDPGFESWRALELAKLDEVVKELTGECGALEVCTWGKRNRARIRHPLSRAVPVLSSLLDMPAVELPGDVHTIRVQGPAFGASERFAVSPGREAQGYFHMAGGQSGHPLSPYYRAGFGAWAQGRPLPFLPGEATHRLTFRAAPETP